MLDTLTVKNEETNKPLNMLGHEEMLVAHMQLDSFSPQPGFLSHLLRYEVVDSESMVLHRFQDEGSEVLVLAATAAAWRASIRSRWRRRHLSWVVET